MPMKRFLRTWGSIYFSCLKLGVCIFKLASFWQSCTDSRNYPLPSLAFQLNHKKKPIEPFRIGSKTIEEILLLCQTICLQVEKCLILLHLLRLQVSWTHTQNLWKKQNDLRINTLVLVCWSMRVQECRQKCLVDSRLLYWNGNLLERPSMERRK